ncbi:MAG: phage portal protein [Beijerinckiaceae bacterium]|nr:phage portal protein [Beijerinckiaceae bacterium]
MSKAAALRQALADWIAPKASGSTQTVDSSQIRRGAESYSWFTEFSGGQLPVPTEVSALACSACYSSINLIAGAMASIPKVIFNRARDGELSDRPDESLYWVLNEQMTPRWSAANGWEFLFQSLLLHGNGYAIIRRDRLGNVLGIEPVHPERVDIVTTPDGLRLIYSISPDPNVYPQQSARTVYDQDDVLHIAGFGFDGVKGISVLRHALRMTGGAAIAMQDYAANFFANNARPDFALETDQNLGPEAVGDLYASLDERHRGPAKAHRPIILSGGLKVRTITMPLTDVQLLEQRKFAVEEVARIYGVPPFMIGHTEKTSSWGTGVESMGTGFVRYALRQHIHKAETELNRKLFRTSARVVKFDTADLERADTKSLMESLRIGIGRAGERSIISVNEARAVLRRNRIEGGDNLSINVGAQPQDTPERLPE